jgi:hypothetical protein
MMAIFITTAVNLKYSKGNVNIQISRKMEYTKPTAEIRGPTYSSRGRNRLNMN